ncbi:hypothetical protein Glove_410g36 [Diversispora epigaea]|uniref:Uncharacterized protein n=1 Tax=Diversispora epigaea TaxID=1348612 RepID=A0A397GY83_9GLOM|nr:hypothetical protein Glove_410g36 [Diversispora epigaea]
MKAGMVTATSIKVLHEMNFDTMPAIGINVVLTGVTTQTVRNENDYSVLDFNIDEYLGDLEPKNFWLEVKHKANNRYLINKTIENNIEDFENEQVIFLKGKFIAHEGWYVLHEMNFDTMPAIGINVVLTGVTTQTVRNENDYSVLDFNIDEYLGDLEPKNFWLEVKHKVNNQYLINKTSSINQNSRSTTAILVGIIKNVSPINDPVTNLEISPFKFVLDLEDISLIYNNNYNNQTNNNQTINAPWLNPRQPYCIARGASPRTTRRRLTNTFTTALNSNPLPNMNVLNSQQEQPEQSEQSKPPTKTTRKTRTTRTQNN